MTRAYTLPLFTDEERSADLQEAVNELATANDALRGAIYTKPQIVTFMLDLAGYTIDKDLTHSCLLEPSCGTGEFALVAADRLLKSYADKGGSYLCAIHDLAPCIRAVEVHRRTAQTTRVALTLRLRDFGMDQASAESLATTWIVNDDFLLSTFAGKFTHIVGNPPYLRQERIPAVLLRYYRNRYHTLFDRADLYIPFFERGLELLAPDGLLAFICSDRWLKNRYGGPLRQLIAKDFNLDAYIDLSDAEPFQSAVTAYPSIVVLSRHQSTTTRIVRQPTSDSEQLQSLLLDLSTPHTGVPSRFHIRRDVTKNGSYPWSLQTDTAALNVVERIESTFPLLADVGCKVGIGVATGCDMVYIGQRSMLPIEEERLLPIVMASDIRSGKINWSGNYLANPFSANGKLVALADYPQLSAYYTSHRAAICRRYVSKANPIAWYRTIDKVDAQLTQQPKLLIPDIKGTMHVVFDPGGYYPHHNLYVITAATWDLRALQAVLSSPLAQLFVETYSVTMRGGYLRFQAQYLRRIRLPAWDDVPLALRNRLSQAADAQQWSAVYETVYDIYDLTAGERSILWARTAAASL